MTSRRNQLLKKLIGTAIGEDEKKLYQLTIERVCADMCEFYYKFYHNDGPGAMVYVPTHEDEKKSMFYLTVNNLIHAVDDLNKNDLEGAADVMKKAIVRAEKLDPDKEALFIIQDKEVALMSAVAPKTIKAGKARGFGIERKQPGIVKTGFRTLGRGLGVAASPGLLAPLAAMDITRQISEGDSPVDIATDPLNYLYPAFADQTPKLTRGLPSAVRGIASLGMSPAALRLLSRAGLLGLGASLGLQGMKLLQDD